MTTETLTFSNGVHVTREVMGPDPLDDDWIIEQYTTRDAAGMTMSLFYRRFPRQGLTTSARDV